MIVSKIIADKYDSLRNAGSLDSMVLQIKYFRNPFNEIESDRTFYIYQDTVWRYGYIKAIGKSIIDLKMDFYAVKVGEWTSYYSNGCKAAHGYYDVGAFTFCERRDNTILGYGYPIGTWSYWYENGNLMAIGEYDYKKSIFPDPCGPDTIIESKPTKEWIVFDKLGNLMQGEEKMNILSWVPAFHLH